MAGWLRDSSPPIPRHFFDPESKPGGHVKQLYIKREAFELLPAEEDICCGPSEGFEAALRVAHAFYCEHSDQAVKDNAHHLAVLFAATSISCPLCSARSNNNFLAIFDVVEDLVQISGRHRQINVCEHPHLTTGFEHALPDGGALSSVLFIPDKPGWRSDQVCSSVRTAIVHEKELRLVLEIVQEIEERLLAVRQPLGFVVYRDNDGDIRTHWLRT